MTSIINKMNAILSETFIAQDDEEVMIDKPINTYVTVRFHIRFLGDQQVTQPTIQTRVKGFDYYLDFRGWQNSSEPVVSARQELGQLMTENLNFQVFHQRAGTAHLVFIQALLAAA